MIAADSSSLSAYFKGLSGNDVELIESSLRAGQLALPPVVLTEVLSGPNSTEVEPIMRDLPMLDLSEDYWLLAGRMRRLLLAKGVKAKVADTLIAQSCLDHRLPLITRDPDFRHFAKYCGLRLA